MKKLIAILFILSLLGFACSNNSIKDNNHQLLIGKWKSLRDSNLNMEFSKNYYLNIYTGCSPDSVIYTLSSLPICNNNYITDGQKEEELLFLNTICPLDRDTLCYEVLTLNDSILSIRETSRGYISVYNKQH